MSDTDPVAELKAAPSFRKYLMTFEPDPAIVPIYAEAEKAWSAIRLPRHAIPVFRDDMEGWKKFQLSKPEFRRALKSDMKPAETIADVMGEYPCEMLWWLMTTGEWQTQSNLLHICMVYAAERMMTNSLLSWPDVSAVHIELSSDGFEWTLGGEFRLTSGAFRDGIRLTQVIGNPPFGTAH